MEDNVKSRNRIGRHSVNSDKVMTYPVINYVPKVLTFLFLNPQDEVGPSISSSVVQCSFVLLVCFLLMYERGTSKSREVNCTDANYVLKNGYKVCQLLGQLK